MELIYGQLDIETITKPSGEEDRFRYEVIPPAGSRSFAPHRAGQCLRALALGPVVGRELAELPEGWKVKQSKLQRGRQSAREPGDGPSATVGLDQDDAVNCTFELELLAPKPGRWKTNNKAGTVVCSKGGFSSRST